MVSPLCHGLFAAALAGLAPAQDPAAWLRDLGKERSEAAEIALLQLGAKAVKPLASWLQEFDRSQPDAEARLRAVLRVIELLGADAAELQVELDPLAADPETPALAELVWTRGSLSPYSSSREWSGAFHKAAIRNRGERARLLPAFQRHSQRLCVSTDEGVDRLLQRLVENKIFEREVAAELLGRSGAKEAIEPLQQRLLDRQTQPVGWDGLKHNGLVVPMQDGFRLRAAEALLRLLPESPGAVALGCRALLHPHHSVRLGALHALGSLGPDAQEAVPELLQLARSDDTELAAEALKVLGMSGTAAPGCLAVAVALAQSPSPEVQKRAHSLAARLQAMKVQLPAPDVAATADPAIAAAVAKLGATPDAAAAATALLQAGVAAVEPLRARLVADGDATPDAVLRLLAVVGRKLDADARAVLRSQVMQRHGDNWQGPSMSMASGGGASTDLDREVYAELCIGEPATAGELAAFLLDENAFVRLYAARRLAALGEALRREGEPVQAALLTAARSEHPQKSQFETGPHNFQGSNSALDRPIQAAAAAALLQFGLGADVQAELLPKVIAFHHPAVVAAALQHWGSIAALEPMRHALADERAAVAVAAAEAIGKLGKAAAAAVPQLRRAAASKDAAVAAAASAALLLVQGP